jgi:hypothetical protein
MSLCQRTGPSDRRVLSCATSSALHVADKASASRTKPPSAKTVLSTTDGLVIEAELFVRGPLYWIKLGARAGTPEAEPLAQALNARVGPWAYGLTETDYTAVAPPIADAANLAVAPALGAAAAAPRPPRPAAPKPAPPPEPSEPTAPVEPDPSESAPTP